jgi:hypothetical protein
MACFRQLFLGDHDACVSKRGFMLCWESAGEMLAGLDHVYSLGKNGGCPNSVIACGSNTCLTTTTELSTSDHLHLDPVRVVPSHRTLASSFHADRLKAVH